MTKELPSKEELLQRHLAVIRGCAGWTAATLADKLGVTRQAISMIEQKNKSYKMTRMQYMAIRRAFDEEINDHPEDTRMLKTVIDVLVDNPNSYTLEERNEILKEAELLAPSIIKTPNERRKLSSMWKTILIASGVVATLALKTLLSDKE